MKINKSIWIANIVKLIGQHNEYRITYSWTNCFLLDFFLVHVALSFPFSYLISFLVWYSFQFNFKIHYTKAPQNLCHAIPLRHNLIGTVFPFYWLLGSFHISFNSAHTYIFCSRSIKRLGRLFRAFALSEKSNWELMILQWILFLQQ